MPIYLFEPDKPMCEVYSLPTRDSAIPKSYAYMFWSGGSNHNFYVYSTRLEDWLHIKPEGVPPHIRAMALLIPTP